MLAKWGATAAAVFVTATGFLGSPPPPPSPGPAEPSPTTALPGGVAVDVKLRLERDGRLTVTEKVVVPEGKQVTRRVPLRQAVGDDLERVYSVDTRSFEGPDGGISAGPDTLAAEMGPGTSTLKYTVDGVAADVGEGQEARWQVTGGWDTDIDTVTISFVSPTPPRSVTCLAGAVGSTTGCDVSQITDGHIVRAQEIGLKAGHRLDLAVGMEPGTVPATARFEKTFSLAGAFALTPATGAGLGGLTLFLVGGVALLWWARGRDTRALASDVGPVTVLVTDAGGRVGFASPDGVLPGQVGTVVDEHVDVVDVAATVVDLAVRNYLWIEEVPGPSPDWRIVRRNPPDEHLRAYERAVYEALLPSIGPGGRDHVRVSELGGAGLDLTAVRDHLYRDVVASRWFQHRPDNERSRWWWIGLGVGLAGVVLTVVLTLTTHLALLGLAVLVGGSALVIGSRWMPARTRRGSALIEQVRGLREYLRSATPDTVPVADREMVFSRSLPYAVVLGEADHWLQTFAVLDPGADGTPGLYWYGGADDGDLRRFAQRFPAFLAALDGALAEADHLRSLRAST
ncbi:hypothetical protein GCM10012275_11340 [Longimycelium tulufanense]|uniref:DUF2207 domain-containing protein n=1 Tax=Longimycelium tulufanense TaxID=907463 RepID=A0A8J3CD38_9PSEU|nr:DUF2207 domain-containing protein [Longimycelium tulufanense]GGM42088.1 hypothetical protein GCM10012275_11340 [Longimycelium tulufanense]